jgi:hypothetical protein
MRDGSAEKVAGNNAASAAMLVSDFVLIFTAASWLRLSIAGSHQCVICQLSMPNTAHPSIAELGKWIVHRDSVFFLVTAG